MNILMNAIDALEDSDRATSGQIRITTEQPDPAHITIRIADNGTGMPTMVQARIFDPFFTTKSVGKGTGMGLAICYQIITQNHGGQLTCHSTIGQGSEFVITIPIHQ